MAAVINSYVRVGHVFLLAALFSATAFAQTTPDAEELRRRQQQEALEREQVRRAPDVRLQAEPGPAEIGEFPTDVPCFTVSEVKVIGDPQNRFTWLAELAAPYAGRCVGTQGINFIARRMQADLIRRGYITTRIGVPEQDLSSGRLTLTVVPGVISSIRFADPQMAGSWYTAFPVGPGDLLNLRDLEQGLEQLKRVPSQDVDFKIVPGEAAGDSDVVISVKRVKPWRIAVTFDDAGTKATGKLQSALTFSLDSPFGINDLFYATFNSNVDHNNIKRGTRGDSLHYSVPFGYWTFSAGVGNSQYYQTVQGTNQTFIYSGQSNNIELRAHRTLHRDQTSKTGMQLRVIKRHSYSYIEDTEIAVQRRKVTSAELALTHRHYLGAATLDLQLANRKGVPWFQAQDDLPGAGTTGPTTRYDLWVLDATFAAPMRIADTPARYTFNLRAQHTRDRVFQSEFFSIGNRYTVRGFDGEQTLSAERGWLVRNELALPIQGTQHEFYAGLDHGQVGGPSSGVLLGTRLSGFVLGLRGGVHGMNYEIFAGWALAKPDGYKTTQPAVGFQLAYQF